VVSDTSGEAAQSASQLSYSSMLFLSAPGSRQQPYASFIDRLTRFLEQDDALLIVAGSSFGDEHINNLIFGALPRHQWTLRQSAHRCRTEAQGRGASRGRIERLMRRHGIRAITARPRRVRTTDSRHDFPIAPNLLERNFTAAAPNRIWLADITYIETDQGWLYLATVMDLYSRKIVGWAMADHLRRWRDSFTRSRLRSFITGTIQHASTPDVISLLTSGAIERAVTPPSVITVRSRWS
jgi:transposase InsO family protein